MKPIVVDKPTADLKPLDVSCSHTRCEEGFHFYTSTVAPKGGKVGDCKSCGDASIDWDRIHADEKPDVPYIFESLKKELLRHVCWVNTIDVGAIDKAKERGKTEVLVKAKEIITKKIAKIPTGYFDYLCTPTSGREIVHYAQHATATCCRRCVARWHNIPEDVLLSESQVDYFVELIGMYIDEKVPDITNEGIQN